MAEKHDRKPDDFERGDRRHGRGRKMLEHEKSDFSLESLAEGYGVPKPPGARKRRGEESL